MYYLHRHNTLLVWNGRMPSKMNAECAGAMCRSRVLFMSVNAWLIQGEEHMIPKRAADWAVQLITRTRVC